MFCNNSNEWLRLMADIEQEEAIPPGRPVRQSVTVAREVAQAIDVSGIYRMDRDAILAELETFKARVA